MERIEPTRKIALKIWWAVIWRYMLSLMIIGLLQSLLLAVIVASFELNPLEAERTSGVLFLLFGLPMIFLVSWELVYRVLRKKFSNFELAVIRPESDDELMSL